MFPLPYVICHSSSRSAGKSSVQPVCCELCLPLHDLSGFSGWPERTLHVSPLYSPTPSTGHYAGFQKAVSLSFLLHPKWYCYWWAEFDEFLLWPVTMTFPNLEVFKLKSFFCVTVGVLICCPHLTIRSFRTEMSFQNLYSSVLHMIGASTVWICQRVRYWKAEVINF